MDQKEDVIITGATGLIGSRIVELLSSKFNFIALNREDGIDITNEDQVSEFIKNQKAEVILHLAAYTNTSEAEKQADDENGECFRVNVVGTRNLAEVARKYDKHLIFFSTDFVFDGEKNEPYNEEDSPNPIGWYAKTKFLAEEEIKKSEAVHTIVRTSYPFRANFQAKPDIVHKIINGFKDGKLSMFDDSFITPTFVDDISEGVGGLLMRKPQGIFNLTGNDFVTPYELSIRIARIFGFDPKIVKSSKAVDFEKETGRKYMASLKMNNEKIKKFLNINIHSLDEALEIVKNQESH